MTITIIRHAKVIYEWRDKYTSQGYDNACTEYDSSLIVEDGYNIKLGSIERIYISELRRTYDTAKNIFGHDNFTSNKLFNEVPIKSFSDINRPIHVAFWNILGRIQWLLNIKRQPETKKQTIQRALAAIDILEKEGLDCCLICHGFFMKVLIKQLEKKGYVIQKTRKFSIKNLDQIIATK